VLRFRRLSILFFGVFTQYKGQKLITGKSIAHYLSRRTNKILLGGDNGPTFSSAKTTGLLKRS